MLVRWWEKQKKQKYTQAHHNNQPLSSTRDNPHRAQHHRGEGWWVMLQIFVHHTLGTITVPSIALYERVTQISLCPQMHALHFRSKSAREGMGIWCIYISKQCTYQVAFLLCWGTRCAWFHLAQPRASNIEMLQIIIWHPFRNECLLAAEKCFMLISWVRFNVLQIDYIAIWITWKQYSYS